MIVVLALVHAPVLRGLARWLDVGQRPVAVDYAVVLPGELNTRPFVAAALVNKGLARRVIVPEPRTRLDVVEGRAKPHEEVTRMVLESRGVAADDILIAVGQSGSTFDDARTVLRLLQDQPQASIAVVTNSLHTRRAKWAFERVFGSTAHHLCFVSAPTDGFSAENWWQTREGLQAYVNEFMKLPVYWIYYGHGLAWLTAGAVVAIAILVVVRRRRRTSAQKKAADAIAAPAA
jgi:uncharacterized SAM-binding protein YcdF (DUF218 family)